MQAEVGRLLDLYDNATDQQYEEGRGWYRARQREIRRLSEESGLSRSVVAGVIAALSPRMRWKENVKCARELLLHGRVPRCMEGSKSKAMRIYTGARPLQVLGGPKTLAFYRALMGDTNAAVIDVWMFRAMGMEPTSNRFQVDYATDCLREAASIAGIPCAEFQAVVWCAIRGGGD